MNPTPEQIRQVIAGSKAKHELVSNRAEALSALCADMREAKTDALLGVRVLPVAEAMRDEALAEAAALKAQIMDLERMLPGGILIARPR